MPLMPNRLMKFFSYIFQDWKVNRINIKAQLILLSFRLAQILRGWPKPIFPLAIPYLVFYRCFVEWSLGIELPWNTQVGAGLKLYHGQALVVNDHTVIGANCTLRNSTTIGHKNLPDGSLSGSPEIGDNVDIGANVVILGSIKIGNNVIIGAGSIVVKDIPDNSVVVGNPAKIIRSLQAEKTYETTF
jgi:putative colanic acid biosynthesis acetyltransferase WcaB